MLGVFLRWKLACQCCMVGWVATEQQKFPSLNKTYTRMENRGFFKQAMWP